MFNDQEQKVLNTISQLRVEFGMMLKEGGDRGPGPIANSDWQSFRDHVQAVENIVVARAAERFRQLSLKQKLLTLVQLDKPGAIGIEIKVNYKTQQTQEYNHEFDVTTGGIVAPDEQLRNLKKRAKDLINPGEEED